MPAINGIKMNGEIPRNFKHDSPLGSNGVEADVPILIIGGGPTGLLLAYLLSSYKVPNLIVERYPQRLGAPKAHALSPRSLEICRQANLDVKKIRSLGTQRRDAYTVNFVRSLSGERVGYLPYERMDPAVLDATPEMIHNIPQPDYEQFMTEQLVGSQYTEVRKGVSFVSLSQNEETGKVTTLVEERDSGRQYAITSRHVIACDGARSKVRTFLGIDSEGEDTLDTMMTIHFNANLRPIINERVGMLHWIMDRDVSGFIIGYDLSDNQVLICNFDSKKHPADSWDEAQCRKIVDKAIGQPAKYDILGFRPWTLSRKVAKEYQIGNVFLAGDAAHSFPPTGGLGLNSGLGDVHNIAYKLAGVHQGWASESILLSYKADRHMVALINSQQSVKNGQTIFKLLKMGSLPKRKTIPRSRTRKLQERKKQKLVQEGIAGQREHFDNLELHIGYVYGSNEIPPDASAYTQKFIPGAVFPHTWITLPKSSSVNPPEPVDVSYVDDFGPKEIQERRYSTLDLVSPLTFTFVTANKLAWDKKLAQLQSLLPRPAPLLASHALGTDFEILQTNAASKWKKQSGLETGATYLLRPDQHILAVLRPKTTPEMIATILETHLGN